MHTFHVGAMPPCPCTYVTGPQCLATFTMPSVVSSCHCIDAILAKVHCNTTSLRFRFPNMYL